MKIDPTIFGMYDIRGIYRKNLSDEVIDRISRATATFFLKRKIRRVVLGRDNRTSGSKISQIFIEGLLSSGVEVIDIGTVMTPMIYFSWEALKAGGTVMITASHNPPEYNGFKIGLNKQAIFGDKYQEIKILAESENFKKGKGTQKKYNLWPEYLVAITKDIKIKRSLKVAIDCGNGTTGKFALEFIKKLDCLPIGLYTDSDGTFPNHPPYPQKVEYYRQLIGLINKEKADVGIAFDGDGDRVGFYNEKGDFIENDILTILFIREILKSNSKAKIVMNISTSLAVIDDVKKHGGEVVLWKTGYPFITSKMKEVGAIFGAEISGHFFFADRYYGFDDAFYATSRLLEIISSSRKSFSELFSDIPPYFSTQEFRIKVPEKQNNNKFTIIKKITKEVKKEYPQAEILDFDGVRFNFSEGWGLIRASNTQPMLTGRTEARNRKKLEEIKEIIKNKLKENGVKLDWDKPIEA